MWQVDHKEGWAPKNWCFWTEVLEKTLESPLDCKEIQPVHPKVLTNSLEGLMLKLKLQYFGHLMWRADSLEGADAFPDPDAGKDWRQKKKRVTKDEMVGWHHQLKGHELGQIRICLLLEEMVWDREVWCAAVYGVSKTQTWPGNWTTTTVLYKL